MFIESVEVWTVSFPLTRPVVLGPLRYESRDYCVVRITGNDGAHGLGYGLSRGAPVAASVNSLVPLVVGRDPWSSEAIWQDLYINSIARGARGEVGRAISLLDVAIWDLKGRSSGVSLTDLMGRLRDNVPVSMGGGYFRDQRAPEEVAEELAKYAELGYQHVKIPAGGKSPAEEESWVEMAREAVGTEVALAVDSHWTWRDVTTAQEVIDRFEPFKLAWVEDPVWGEAVASAARLRRTVRTPIAIGDEQTGRWAYQNLLLQDAADVWRVDVTTVGGITEFRRIAGLASCWGIPVSTHMSTEIHLHCAAAEDAVRWVEHVDPQQEIDFMHRLISDPAMPEGGLASPSAGPGLGFDLDWDAIDGMALEKWQQSANGQQS